MAPLERTATHGGNQINAVRLCGLMKHAVQMFAVVMSEVLLSL